MYEQGAAMSIFKKSGTVATPSTKSQQPDNCGSDSRSNPSSALRVERSNLPREVREAIRTNIQIGRATTGSKKK
jgi:hypothetical protein